MILLFSLKTLLRSWWRTMLFVLLCAVGIALLSLGVSLYLNSKSINEKLSSDFTTIAVFDYYELRTSANELALKNPQTKNLPRQGREQIQLTILTGQLGESADSTSCAHLDRRNIYSGYIDGIKTRSSVSEAWNENKGLTDNALTPLAQISNFDYSYMDCCLIVTCMGKESLDSEQALKLNVDSALIFNDSLPLPQSVYFIVNNYFVEGDEINMEIGESYIVFCSIHYGNTDESPVTISINMDAPVDESTGEVNFRGYACFKLGNSLEEALASPDGERIEDLMELCRKNVYSVDVFSVGNVNSILQFNKGELFITEGDSFLKDQYIVNDKVCLMSESLAYDNGIHVGDKVELDIYYSSPVQHGTSPDSNSWSRMPICADSELLFDDAYTVIGLFKTPEWELRESKNTISPNTIFIPSEWTEDSHTVYVPSSMSSIVIDNGYIEQFLVEMDALQPGSSKYFKFYDQGFSEVLPVVETFVKNAKSLGIMSVGVWGLTAALFVLIMVLVNRRDVGIMLSLGSGRRKAFCALFTRYFIIAVLGSALGGLAAYLLFDRALAYLGEFSAGMISSGTSFSFTGDPINTVYCALAALGALTVVSLASAALSARANARELLR